MKKQTRVLAIMTVLALGALLCMFALGDATPQTQAQGPEGSEAIQTNWLLKGNKTTATSFLGTKNNQPLIFKTNKVEQMRIDTAGKVGIGTASPSARAEIAVANEDDLALRLLSGPNAFLDIKPSGATQTIFDTVNNRNMVFSLGTGRTEINVSAEGNPALRMLVGPNAFLDVKPTNTGGKFQTVLDTVNNRDLVVLTGSGNVGIGTTSPAYTLNVIGSASIQKGLSSIPLALAAFQAHNGGTSGEAALFRTESAANPNAVLKSVKEAGGTNDFFKCARHNANNTETQLCHIDTNGTFHAGSDFAEALAAKGGKSGYEPGDVVVLGTDPRSTVEKSNHPYDVHVVGVYSTRPAVLGEDAGSQTGLDNIPVAVIGIVPTKVTAENGAIQRGDLLTTSSTPGYAMKARPMLINGVEIYPPGTILGKALGSLESGTGMIPVLITLR
ncbi:MAG: hypothetical protein HY741_05920 [Chloroflexi bacterium]|nr:hypothetical protein [Chloroflexota bacterium]